MKLNTLFLSPLLACTFAQHVPGTFTSAEEYPRGSSLRVSLFRSPRDKDHFDPAD
jgi:hypothetical protein